MKTWRIALVDDHPMFRDGLRGRLSIESDLEIVGEADDLPSALKLADELEPDLLIVDVSLGDGSGIDLVKRLRARGSDVRVLVLSMYEEELYADRALKAGAQGYVTKHASSETIIEAVRRVLAGKVYLSPEFSEQLVNRMVLGREGLEEDPVSALSDRELEVYQFIGRGQTTSEIAKGMHLSVHTIETHRQRIKQKLDPLERRRTDAFRHAMGPRERLAVPDTGAVTLTGNPKSSAALHSLVGRARVGVLALVAEMWDRQSHRLTTALRLRLIVFSIHHVAALLAVVDVDVVLNHLRSPGRNGFDIEPHILAESGTGGINRFRNRRVVESATAYPRTRAIRIGTASTSRCGRTPHR